MRLNKPTSLENLFSKVSRWKGIARERFRKGFVNALVETVKKTQQQSEDKKRTVRYCQECLDGAGGGGIAD